MNEIVLPKWPQMLASGKSVTPEQAKDIIFKTDYFFTDASPYSGGNCREFSEQYRVKAGLETLQYVRNSANDGHSWIDVDWDRQDLLRHRLGVVLTRYVHNDWASSSYVGGPHGWCHPDGTIGFSDNVGKWPTVNELLEDWTDIAQAFPYLDLHITLMDSESYADGPRTALFNIRVIGGYAMVEQPDLTVHDKQIMQRPDQEVQNAEWIARLQDNSLELGLPEEWYDEFADRVREMITTL